MNCGMRSAECGRGERSRCARSFRNPQSAIRLRALTLIELLIVIVILTTLVAGVIPVLSPNNDVRKIRAAARGLQGHINLVQAQAARTGRPHGIAFRESSPGSGVALEVFTLEVPPPFAGFSTASAARIEQAVGSSILNVQFILADTLGLSGNPVPNEYEPDALPPNFIRYRDRISIDGVEYRFIQSGYDSTTGFYLNPPATMQVEKVEASNQTLAFVKSYNGGNKLLTAPKRYQIHRQAANSSAEPYQLPAGIVIDMQGSLAEGSKNMGVADRFPVAEASLFSATSTTPNTVGILFSPTGAVSRLLFNGSESRNASKIVLLIGRIENGGIDASTISANSSGVAPWRLKGGEKVEDVQQRINWLNLDSRLLSIAARSGRVVVSETAFVDPEDPTGIGTMTSGDLEIAEQQIEAAHGFAHKMTTVGGR